MVEVARGGRDLQFLLFLVGREDRCVYVFARICIINAGMAIGENIEVIEFIMKIADQGIMSGHPGDPRYVKIGLRIFDEFIEVSGIVKAHVQVLIKAANCFHHIVGELPPLFGIDLFQPYQLKYQYDRDHQRTDKQNQAYGR